jgi:hypothetical protein
MFLELLSRTNLGLGTLKFEKVDALRFLLLTPENLSFILKVNITEQFLSRTIKSIFEELDFSKCTQKNCKYLEHSYEFVKSEEVYFDKMMPDRSELDKFVFDALGLIEDEQLQVYCAVLELVKNCLLKVKSK